MLPRLLTRVQLRYLLPKTLSSSLTQWSLNLRKSSLLSMLRSKSSLMPWLLLKMPIVRKTLLSRSQSRLRSAWPNLPFLTSTKTGVVIRIPSLRFRVQWQKLLLLSLLPRPRSLLSINLHLLNLPWMIPLLLVIALLVLKALAMVIAVQMVPHLSRPMPPLWLLLSTRSLSEWTALQSFRSCRGYW